MGTATEKEEVKKILEGRNRAAKRRSSRRLLILKIGAGYAAMAIFTTAALAYSAYSLGAINKTAHDITYKDLPTVSSLTKLRFSLLAQERFAGRYAILRDPAFMELYRQREKESLANLRALQASGAPQEFAVLMKLYREYQAASRRLFNAPDTTGHRASATELLRTIDTLYARRQVTLHDAIRNANKERRRTIRWTIGISLAGFFLTVWIAPLVINRIFRDARKLQMATHQALAGNFRLDEKLPACEEIQDLADDVTKLAGNIAELEQLSFDPARLSGDPVTERMLEEQLKSGTPFAFCHAEVADLRFFTIQHGYGAGCRLLRLTGFLLHAAVARAAPEGFAFNAGGNGFVMIVPSEKAEPVCQEATRSFDAEIAAEFGPDGFTSITIRTVLCGTGHLTSVAAITDAVDALKEDAGKREPASLAAPAPISIV